MCIITNWKTADWGGINYYETQSTFSANILQNKVWLKLAFVHELAGFIIVLKTSFRLRILKIFFLLENCQFLFTVLPTCFVNFHKEVYKVRWICQSTLHQLSSLNFSTHTDNCRFVLIKLKTHLTHCAFRWYLFDRQKHKYQRTKRQTSMLERDENPFFVSPHFQMKIEHDTVFCVAHYF